MREASITLACAWQAVYGIAIANGVRMLEVLGSPRKYHRGDLAGLVGRSVKRHAPAAV
jgi:hypothetical protein